MGKIELCRLREHPFDGVFDVVGGRGMRIFRAKTIRDVVGDLVGVFGDAAGEFVVCAVYGMMKPLPWKLRRMGVGFGVFGWYIWALIVPPASRDGIWMTSSWCVE
jgi:hypothetical protein